MECTSLDGMGRDGIERNVWERGSASCVNTRSPQNRKVDASHPSPTQHERSVLHPGVVAPTIEHACVVARDPVQSVEFRSCSPAVKVGRVLFAFTDGIANNNFPICSDACPGGSLSAVAVPLCPSSSHPEKTWTGQKNYSILGPSFTEPHDNTIYEREPHVLVTLHPVPRGGKNPSVTAGKEREATGPQVAPSSNLPPHTSSFQHVVGDRACAR